MDYMFEDDVADCKIKKTPVHPTIRNIMLNVSTDLEETSMFLQVGANGLIKIK